MVMMKRCIICWSSFLLTLTASIHATENDCSTDQFWNREKRTEIKNCTENKIYHCAWDLFKKEYKDICWSITIPIRKGTRPTIQGGLHYGNCTKDRYQPFVTISQDITDCVYLKTKCTEEGQVVYNDTESTSKDRTCRCDYRKGYAFVRKPKNVCFCIPSQEDCSCYRKRCKIESEQLSRDYVCVERKSTRNQDQSQCLPITDPEISGQSQQPPYTKSDEKTVTDAVSSSFSLATGIFVTILVICVLTISLLIFCPFHLRLEKNTHGMKEGDTASIRVYVYGVAFVHHFKWTYLNSSSDLAHDDSEKYSVFFETSNHFCHIVTLKIDNLTTEDSRTYVCSVSRYIGTTCIKTSLQIAPNPAATVIRNTTQEILEHTEDDTYYETEAVTKGKDILEKHNTLFVKGHEGFGKTKVCLHLAKYFSEKGFVTFKFSTNDTKNPDDYICPEKKHMCIYDLNIQMGAFGQSTNDLLSTFRRYRANKKLKFIITILSNYGTDQTSINEFKESQILSLLELSPVEKKGILYKHMRKNNIDTCDYSYDVKYDGNEPLKIWVDTVEKICNTDTLLGFPKACKLFCSNRSFLRLEERYFKNPPKWTMSEITNLRKDMNTKLQYAVLVYVMIQNELNTTAIDYKRMEYITGKLRIYTYESYELNDAATTLCHHFLRQDKNTFKFYHEMMSKAVWLTYIDIDPAFCITNCDWEYIEDLIRPKPWKLTENDDCIEVEPIDLFLRLSKEIKDNALFVGVYLRKLSEHGKYITEKLFSDCTKGQFETDNLTEVPLTLFEGLTEFGKYCDIFVNLDVSNNILGGCALDRYRNNLFHYSVCHDYIKLVEKLTESQIELFAGLANAAGYTAFHLAVYLGRKSIFEKIFDEVPVSNHLLRQLRKLSFEGSKQQGSKYNQKMVDFNQMKTGQMVFRRNVFYGNRDEFNFIKNKLYELKKQHEKKLEQSVNDNQNQLSR